jgi:hypothetical protein
MNLAAAEDEPMPTMTRILLPLMMFACSDGPIDDVHEVEDAGVACLVGDTDGVVDVVEGEPVQIVVDFGCIGEHTPVDATCQVTVNGDQLVVSAQATYRQSEEQRGLPVCDSPVAVCVVEGLSARTYTLAYADGEVDFDVPSTPAGDVCTGEPTL